VHLSGHNQLAVFDDGTDFFSPGAHRRIAGEDKAPLNPGGGTALTDSTRICPITEEQTKRGNDHRFTGACLAGDDGEPGAQWKSSLADYSKV
jgi:hypothetical protein